MPAQPTAVEMGDRGGPAVQSIKDVGAEDDSRAARLRFRAQKRQQRRAREDIERVGRLIEQDQLPLGQQLAEELHSPALAVRECVQLGREERCEPQYVEQLRDASRARVRRGHSCSHNLAHGQREAVFPVRRDEVDAQGERRVLEGILAEDVRIAGAPLAPASDDAQKGRLARAIGAHEHDARTARHVEVDVGEDGRAPIVVVREGTARERDGPDRGGLGLVADGLHFGVVTRWRRRRSGVLCGL